jgi:hypothetical protein
MHNAVLEALEPRLLLDAGPRQMEYLDRGIVATRSSSTQVFISWRSLVTDAPGMAFNVYRAANGGNPIKVNPSPLIAGTNFTDSAAAGSAYTYTVRSVVNGVESPTDGAYTLPANTPIGPFFTVPLRYIGNYAIEHVTTADLNGDGRYDFIVDRKPQNVVNEVATESTKVEAYLNDGTFLWSVDLGPGSFDLDNIEPGSTAIDVGNWDGVVAYDLDLDGRAEVFLRSANGITFGDGKKLSYPNDNIQFMSVLDGMTGAEKSRIGIPTDFIFDGPMAASFAVGYLDGVHPSLVAKMKNRVGSGRFNEMFVAYDYNGIDITQKWKFISAPSETDNGHNIRVVDVDGDGFDDVADTAKVINGPTGALKYSMYTMTPHIGHGDRFYIGDFDPAHPGLEYYGVQQNNPNMMMEYYADAATGKLIYATYSTSVSDNGRGEVGDIDPSHPGAEFWSFYGLHNVYNSVHTQIGNSSPWPSLGLQWDGDLLAEVLSTDSAVIDQWNPATQARSRVSTLYNMGSGATTWDGWPVHFGDIIGDWREEVVYEKGTRDGLVIFTTNFSTTTRLYTLAQNPLYRNNMTTKGYMQTRTTDYYLGADMTMPPVPNIQVLPKANGPVVATRAAAPATVTGKTAALSVLGADDTGESNIAYTWSALGPAAVLFSSNGNNAARNTTATFFAAGTYLFTVTLTDPAGHVALSNVTVTVRSTLTRLTVSPLTPTVAASTTLQFVTTGYDQFGAVIFPGPAVTWAVTAGTGTVDANGLYTAPASTGSATIGATSGALSASTSITINGPALPTPASLSASPTSPSTVNLAWPDIAGDTGYIIERSTDNLLFTSIALTAANATSYTAVGLSPNTRYYFRVRPSNASGPGLPSPTASATTFLLPFAWYRLDETSGTSAADATGNPVSGLVSGAAHTAGRSGNALSFTASANNYVQLPNDTMSTAAGAVSLWFKTSTNFADDTHIFYFSSDTYGNGGGSQLELHISLNSSERVYFFIEGGSSDVYIANSSAVNNNAWHFVVATWDLSGNASFYLDGALVGSVTDDSTLFPNSQRTFLGRPNLDTRYFNGLIDDVRLYSAPISAAQVSSLYTAAAATNSAPSVVSPAAGAPTPSTIPSITLSVLANDDSGEPNLTYTWSKLSGPAVVNFGVNGTNAAKNTAATFSSPGTYTLRVTIADPQGATTTSDITVAFSPIPGDANFDTKVDAFDLNILAAHWQSTATGGPAIGDFNADGTVDAFDLNIIAAHWQEGVTLTAGMTAEPFHFPPPSSSGTTSTSSPPPTEAGTGTTEPVANPPTPSRPGAGTPVVRPPILPPIEPTPSRSPNGPVRPPLPIPPGSAKPIAPVPHASMASVAVPAQGTKPVPKKAEKRSRVPAIHSSLRRFNLLRPTLFFPGSRRS